MKKVFKQFPNAYVILFFIIILASLLTYIVPSGEFDRVAVEYSSKLAVVPGSYHVIEKTPDMVVTPWWDMFVAIPKGLTSAGIIMMVVFLSGGMFEIFAETGCIETAVGATVNSIKKKNSSHNVAILLMTLFFGFFGVAVGYEQLIPLVPLGVMIALGLGYDLMVGAALVVGSITVGFASSPINPYTVGTSHGIAGLPVFSGMGFRAIFCTCSLLVMAHHTARYAKKIKADPEKSLVKGIDTEGLGLHEELMNKKASPLQIRMLILFVAFILILIFGVVKFKWYLNQLSALFVIMTVLGGIVAGWHPNKTVEVFMRGASKIASGALIVGFARTISVIMTEGKIADTIISSLAGPLQNLPAAVSAIGMTIVQGVINFFIPSGSGQAMATMPIMLPLAGLIGVSPQTAILAFQIGDGVINLIVPTLGGLLAMIAIARVPFDKWFKFAIPLVFKMYILGWTFLIIATVIGW